MNLKVDLGNKFSRFKEVYKISFPFFQFLGRTRLVGYLALTIFFSVLSAVNYIALLPFVGIALSGKSEFFDKYIAGKIPLLDTPFFRDNIFLAVSVAIIAVYLAKFVCGILFCGLSGKYQESYGCHLREELSHRFIDESFRRLNSAKVDYMYEFTLISKVVSINWSFINFHIKVATSLFTFVVLVAYKVKIFVVVVFFAAVWFTTLVPILRKSRKAANAFYNSEKRLNQFFYEQLTSLEIIKVFRVEKKRKQEQEQLSKNIVHAGFIIGVARQAAGSVQELLIVFFVTVALVLASYFSIPAEEVVVFGYLFSRLLGNMNDAVSVISSGIELLPSVDSLKARGIIQFKSSEKEIAMESALPAPPLTDISFEDFSIHTPQGLILNQAAVSFKPGDKVQILGPNGSGKSTFIKALAGLVPFSGKIILNQKEIRVTDPQYYEYISYSPQEPTFFHGTIIENLTLFNSEKESALHLLLARLNLDLEDMFVDWQNYIVVDNGASLSGGQRQILNILRALLKDASILILDEYTNHLSPQNVAKITDYLRDLSGKIVLSVSHTELGYINRRLNLVDYKLVDV